MLGALIVVQGAVIGSEPLPAEETAAEVVTEQVTETVTETATEVRTELPRGFEAREDRLDRLTASLRDRDRRLDRRERRLDNRKANLDALAAELDEQEALVPAVPDGPATVYYDNCSEAEAAGDTPLYAGDPGYASHLDGDGDGVACE